MSRPGPIALALACCLLLAGCSAFGGSSADSDRFETVTPVPVGDAGASESTLPPGITRNGIGSVSVLLGSHRRALENTSYVWTEWERSRSIRESAPNIVVVRDERMTVEGPRVYNHTLSRVRVTRNTTQRFDRNTYADGAAWHQRTTNGSAVAFADGQMRSNRDRFAFAATFAIEQYFSVGNATVTRISEGDTTLYRVQNDDPGRFNEYWSNFSAVAYVEPSGFVRRLTVSYEIERDTVTEVVAYRFAYEQRGNVSVSPPDWLDRAERRDGEG